ncbi:hypothetical protein OE88DRAFT_1131073 [Heliocybe sulcata]|uniref:Uncharacterized protein n=1 Tax=Heliocybe sulcata TaxID=5364 RepID=A0A5C3N9J7_9AGAM|nr:hypothetical protein OE88DRAFT_1131073 [Heliocybe sulcata]
MRRIRCPRRVHCMELGANSRNTEGKSIVQRDYHGAIHNTFSKLTDRATPLDIASVPSDQHIIILVSILSRTPALSSAHKIHLSSDSKIVLVDCDADRKLTQVWRREMIDGTPSGRIQLRHTFVAKAHPLLGESFFAGQGDRCVACLTEDGSIYTWDRESGRLIRRILPTESDAGSISCATWNTCAEGVLATGTSNGEIVMWSASLERPMERIVEDGVMHIDTSRAVNDVDRPNPRRKRSDTM